ncbi:MAG: hypothetical protein ACOH1T_10855 [Microbacteriaceae bacterium]
MLVTAPDRRKIVVLSGDRRVDAAVPLDDTLGESLRALGYVLEPGRHVVLERSGNEIQLDVLGDDILDGTLFSVVDLRQHSIGPVATRSIAESTPDSGGLWWMLGTAGLVVAVLSLIDASTTAEFTALWQRIAGSFVLGVGAVASGVVWTRRKPGSAPTEALVMLAPLSLAFATGVLTISPTLESSAHLAIVTGFIAAGALATLLTASLDDLKMRAAAGAAAVILLVLSAIWGFTLAAGLDAAAAAAISAGAVPPALRFLPTTLVNVPEGFHIDYKHFMTSRWTVRGPIPESPGRVEMPYVRDVVESSTARLITGTILLAAIAATFLPFGITRPANGNVFVQSGTIALIVTVVIALILAPRHSATPVLRWVPRAAAAIVVLAAAIVLSASLGIVQLFVTAGVVLVLGLIVAFILIPIGRGARSLVWSRLGDFFESLAVALSFPAALLAADVLTALRGMMSQ